jgi:uncharacterized protein YbjT (DUF2867 family)
MNVLVLGAYGLIGTEITRRLSADGHRVTGLGRRAAFARSIAPPLPWISTDISALTIPEAWHPHLSGIDAIVNASGALQSGPRDNLAKVQRDAICALIKACEQTSVRKFVQISAPGASSNATTEFLSTKGEADDILRKSTLDWVILKPALVIAPSAHGGTSLIRALAAFPIAQPLIRPDASMHTVDVADVAAAVASALTDPALNRQSFDLGEPSAKSLAEIVSTFRDWLGFAPARLAIHAPDSLATVIAKLADLAGLLGWRAPMRSTALAVLRDGVRIDPEPWRQATGQALPPLAETLARIPATRQERSFARLELIFPVLVATFAVFWIASGAIGLADRETAAAFLSAKLGQPIATAAVIAGSLMDLAVGIAMLFRRTFRTACLAAALVALSYLILGTLLTPALWADPLGPLLKIVPVIGLALALASYAEER